MRQLHHPWDIRTFNVGAAPDLEDEFLSGENGLYLAACNMRFTDMSGEQESSKKIGGEELLYDNINNRCTNGDSLPLPGSYQCVCTIEVNEHIVEVWDDELDTYDSLIRIDGTIVLMHPDFFFTSNIPIQFHKNESCVGGEIYLSDYVNPPLIFNVEDMLKNAGVGGDCTEKYFDEFNIKKYLLQLDVPVDHPVFVELTDQGAGGGLPVGTYQYRYRYVTDDGERTQWTVATPIIPVPFQFSSSSPQFPYVRSFGDDSDISSPTKFGVKIRLRITNLNDFDFIEIARLRYNAGAPLGTLPIVEVLDLPSSIADIEPQEISIREYTDVDSIAIKEVITDDDPTNVMSGIRRAKALRYFNQRLYLMNVEYASRDIQDEYNQLEVNGKKLFPTIDDLGKSGHNDPWQYTYRRPYTLNDRYGFATVMFDGKGERTFADAFTGSDTSGNEYSNFLMPGRRDPVATETRDTSYFGMSRAATLDGTIDETHEVFALTSATEKTEACRFHNILDIDRGKVPSKINSSPVPSSCKIDFDLTPGVDPCLNLLLEVKANGPCVGYTPYRPTSSADSDINDHDYRVNLEVHNGSNWVNYSPRGFAPTYYSTGMACAGLSNLPPSIQSFSIVRTEPAKRVRAQGLAYYALNSAGGGLGSNTTKEQNKIWWYSPDVRQGIFDIEDVIANPTNYEVEVVSALGFFSEMYDGDRRELLSSRGIDMMTYCRILYEDGSINTGDGVISNGLLGYTAFGKWRSFGVPNAGQQFEDCKARGKIFPIQSVSSTPEGRGEYFEIELDNDLFNYPTALGKQDFDEPELRDWHEPVYIVNLVQTGRRVPNQDVDNYLETDHYQKLNSIIGVSTGADDQDYLLVDERWEDCIPTIAGATNPYSTLNRFAFVELSDGTENRWLNITFKTPAEINTILTSLDATGTFTTSDGFTIVGVYVSTEVGNKEFTLKFGVNSVSSVTGVPLSSLSGFSRSLFVPTNTSLVRVKYDSRIPMRFWGGESSTGEAIFSPLDKEYGSDGNPVDAANEFKLNVGFPYKRWHINPRVYIINRTTVGVGIPKRIQSNNKIALDSSVGEFLPARFRQLCAMFTVESRTNMPYAYNTDYPNEYYPLTHYVMRPHVWDAGGDLAANNIFPDYETDYGDELSRWNYGGFRFLPNTNIDYSKVGNFRTHSSKPEVGFNEQNLFCTRIIWSVRRAVNVQDSPGVRTFPALNSFDISDNTGAIKRAFSANTNKGDNLYAFTDGGVCLLIVDKRIINELSGNELATVGTEQSGVQNQLWLSKTIGMSDELWRTAAEWNDSIWFASNRSVYQMSSNELVDIGKVRFHSKLFGDFLDNISAGYEDRITAEYDVLHNEYWLSVKLNDNVQLQHTFNVAPLQLVNPEYDPTKSTSDNIASISEGQTLSLTLLEGQQAVLELGGPTNTLLTAASFTVCLSENSVGPVDIIYNNGFETIVLTTLQPEECACILTQFDDTGNPIPTYSLKQDCPVLTRNCYTLVFSTVKQHWIDSFDYRFDQFLAVKNKMYGMRNMQTYELNKGFILNGVPVEGFIIGGSSKEQFKDKEFVRIRINSDNKPTKVEFFNDISQVKSNEPQAVLDTATNPLALKDYYGFEQFIPRKTDAPNYRMQGRIVLYKIIHNLEEDFKITDVGVQYKLLK